MESLRNQALQRELNRIESEAREHSMTAHKFAAELEAAEQLCVIINAGLLLDKGLEPKVIYYRDGSAAVVIYALGCGVEVLQRAAEAELSWTNAGAFGGEAYKALEFSGFDGVSVIVEHNALAHYLANLAIEKAAA